MWLFPLTYLPFHIRMRLQFVGPPFVLSVNVIIECPLKQIVNFNMQPRQMWVPPHNMKKVL